MKRVLFHADIGPHTGLGHWTRCAQYAKAFQSLGCETSFIGFNEVPEKARYRDHYAQITQCAEQELVDQLKYIKDGFLIFIDSYQIKKSTCEALRKNFPKAKIFYLDDELEKSDFPGEGLIHLGPYKKKDLKSNQFHQLYFGLENYPLGKDWLQLPAKTKIYDQIEIFSVVLGGGDVQQSLEKLLPLLNSLKFKKCRLFLGPYSSVNELGLNQNWQVLQNAEDFPKKISESDVVLCSGGVVSFELASIGMPLLILLLAENQSSASKHFAKDESALLLPPIQKLTKEDFESSLKQIIPFQFRKKLSEKAKAMIPKNGLTRLAMEILKNI